MFALACCLVVSSPPSETGSAHIGVQADKKKRKKDKRERERKYVRFFDAVTIMRAVPVYFDAGVVPRSPLFAPPPLAPLRFGRIAG